MTRSPALGWCVGLLVLLAGCMERDPYLRTDVWRPTGAVQTNLAAMVAEPRDLIRGRGSDGTGARAAGTAVTRVWMDAPRSLTPGGAPPAVGQTGAGGAAGGGGGGGGDAPASVPGLNLPGP